MSYVELPDGTVLMKETDLLPARCLRCGRLFPVPVYPLPSAGIMPCPLCGEPVDTVAKEQHWRFIDPPLEERV